MLRSNEDRLSGLEFIFGSLIDGSGAKGSSQSVGTWIVRMSMSVRGASASASHGRPESSLLVHDLRLFATPLIPPSCLASPRLALPSADRMPVTIQSHATCKKDERKKKPTKGSQGYHWFAPPRNATQVWPESLRHHHPSTLIYRLFQTHAN